MGGNINFYMYNLEEYYAGFVECASINLGPGNGGVDVAVFLYFFFLVPFFLGNDVYVNDFIYGLTNGQFIACISGIILVIISGILMMTFK